jgi:hypothetical protein
MASPSFNFDFIIWRGGAAISASFSEAKERWLLRRSKIEEIYLSSAAWLKHVNATQLSYLHVCTGRLTYNQVLDLQLKSADTTIGDQNLRMKMNIKMYEPSLVPPLELMQCELEKLNSVISRLTDCCRKNGQASELLNPLKYSAKGIWSRWGCAPSCGGLKRR